MSKRIKILRGLLAALEAEAHAIHDEITKGGMSVEDAVTLGGILAGTVKKANNALEPLKGALREVAVDQANGSPGPQYFVSPDGSKCTVVIPKTTLQIRKGTDIEDLKGTLGDAFDAFFETKVKYSPRKDFQRVASKHAHAKTAMAVVDFTDGTPRVSFKG